MMVLNMVKTTMTLIYLMMKFLFPYLLGSLKLGMDLGILILIV